MGEVIRLLNGESIVNKFLSQYKSADSIRSYKSAIKDFFGMDTEYISDIRIKMIRYTDVQKYIKGLFDAGKSDNTIKRQISCLSSLFKFAVDEGVVKENWFGSDRLKKTVKLNTKKGEEIGIAISQKEISELLNKINNKYEKLIINFMVKTGVRVSELIKIKYGDIEVKNGIRWLRVEGKGRKIRYIPIKDELMNDIRDYMKCYKVAEDDELFSISARQVANIVKKWDGRLSPHDLRRTFITNLIKNGASIDVVQRLAGHSSISVTQRYFKEYEKFNEKVLDFITW